MENQGKLKQCVFCDIISKKLESSIVHEDTDFIIINDTNPDAKKHMLCIPKKHFANLFEAELEDFDTVNNMIKYVSQNAQELGVGDGFRLVMNNGEQATQTVFHQHMHVLGGQQLKHMQKNFDINDETSYQCGL